VNKHTKAVDTIPNVLGKSHHHSKKFSCIRTCICTIYTSFWLLQSCSTYPLIHYSVFQIRYISCMCVPDVPWILIYTLLTPLTYLQVQLHHSKHWLTGC